MRVCVIADDAARRAAIVTALESEGVVVIGEGRTTDDAARLARGADLVLVDQDSSTVGTLQTAVRVPVVVLEHDRGARSPDDPTLRIPWPPSGAASPSLQARLRELAPRTGRQTGPVARAPRSDLAPARPAVTPRIVVVGASAGGPQAVGQLLAGLGRLRVPIVVVQHASPDFADVLRASLAHTTPAEIVLATDGLPLAGGTVVLAPPGHDLTVSATGRCRIIRGTGPHTPSVDVCMRSVAHAFAAAAIGVVLTGMGSDGAEGLRAMRDRGALTMVQDRASSAVYGMPAAALRAGGAVQVLPLTAMPATITAAVGG